VIDDLVPATGSDIEFSPNSGDATISWTAATDPATGSDILEYNWCINNIADCSTPNRSGTTVGAVVTTATGAVPALADGTPCGQPVQLGVLKRLHGRYRSTN
jgi:hypothetical protein